LTCSLGKNWTTCLLSYHEKLGSLYRGILNGTQCVYFLDDSHWCKSKTINQPNSTVNLISHPYHCERSQDPLAERKKEGKKEGKERRKGRGREGRGREGRGGEERKGKRKERRKRNK
jgi:hypothetical protein